MLRGVRVPVAGSGLPAVVEDEGLHAEPPRDRRELLDRLQVGVVLGARGDGVRIHVVGVERHGVRVAGDPVLRQVTPPLGRLVVGARAKADEGSLERERLPRYKGAGAPAARGRVLHVDLLLERTEVDHVLRVVDAQERRAPVVGGARRRQVVALHRHEQAPPTGARVEPLSLPLHGRSGGRRPILAEVPAHVRPQRRPGPSRVAPVRAGPEGPKGGRDGSHAGLVERRGGERERGGRRHDRLRAEPGDPGIRLRHALSGEPRRRPGAREAHRRADAAAGQPLEDHGSHAEALAADRDAGEHQGEVAVGAGPTPAARALVEQLGRAERPARPDPLGHAVAEHDLGAVHARVDVPGLERLRGARPGRRKGSGRRENQRDGGLPNARVPGSQPPAGRSGG